MKHILLVDDEPEVAAVFEAGLKASGYSVTIAENGKSALEEVQKAKFDIILLDQMMPDMSGNEVLRALKQDEKTKNIPVAMLTNFSHDELIKEALNFGAADYILKYRVEPKDLVKKIQRLLGEEREDNGKQ